MKTNTASKGKGIRKKLALAWAGLGNAVPELHRRKYLLPERPDIEAGGAADGLRIRGRYITPGAYLRPVLSQVALAEGGQCHVRGRVTDLLTGNPVAGAKIHEAYLHADRERIYGLPYTMQYDATGGLPASTETGYDGTFDIGMSIVSTQSEYKDPYRKDETVRHVVVCEAPGYAREYCEFVCPPGEAQELDFTLFPGAEAKGRVVDAESGLGVAGVEVWAAIAEPDGSGATLRERISKTDDEGIYRFESMRPGPWRFLVVDREQGYAHPPAQDLAMVLNATEAHSLPDLPVTLHGIVKGQVHFPEGTPAPSVQVVPYASGAPESGQTAGDIQWYLTECGVRNFNPLPVLSDADGRFKIVGLPLEVSHDLNLWLPDNLPLRVRGITLTREARVVDRSLSIGEGGTLRGVVQQEDGSPCGRCGLALKVLNGGLAKFEGPDVSGVESNTICDVRVDASGQFSLSGLPFGGRYCLVYSHCSLLEPPAEVYSLPFSVSPEGPSTFVRMTVPNYPSKLEAHFLQPELRLQKIGSATIRGTLQYPNGHSIDYASVILVPKHLGEFNALDDFYMSSHYDQGSDGVFGADGVPDGDYEVRVDARCVSSPESISVRDGQDVDGLEIVIDPIEYDRLEGRLTGTVWGRVEDATGNPVAGAVVEVCRQDTYRKQRGAVENCTLSRTDGYFAIRIEADRWRLRQQHYILVSAPEGFASASYVRSGDSIRLRLRKNSLRGTVRGECGEAIPGCVVYLPYFEKEDEDCPLLWHWGALYGSGGVAVTDEAGDFEIQNAETGTHFAAAIHPGGRWGKSALFCLPAGGNLQGIDITLSVPSVTGGGE